MDLPSTTLSGPARPVAGPTPPHASPGMGRVRITAIDGDSRPTHSFSTNPLKLLTPRRPGPAAWIYTSTFGGGLVAGDDIAIHLDLQPATTTVLTTQASTKVYRAHRGRTCRQRLTATVGPGGILAVTPDPLVCFRGAVYEQHNRLALAEDASLVYVDWLTSGRRARGECWQFARVAMRLEVLRGERPLLLESLVLDPRDGPLDGPLRLGEAHCLAFVVVLGGPFTAGARGILESAGNAATDGDVLEAASPLDDGVLWRMIGRSTEAVGTRLRERLGFLAEQLGESPWERKW